MKVLHICSALAYAELSAVVPLKEQNNSTGPIMSGKKVTRCIVWAAFDHISMNPSSGYNSNKI